MTEPTTELESPDGILHAALPPTLVDLMQKQRGWKTCSGPHVGRAAAARTAPMIADNPAETVPAKQVYAQGIDPEVAVPQSYIPGMVIGVTGAKMTKLIKSGAVPYYMKGTAKMVKPSDVAAALEAGN